jgi:hypothetical protein
MSGAQHRRKGSRVERELVQLHKALRIHCERYPLSGASRFRGSGHDLDIYANASLSLEFTFDPRRKTLAPAWP